MPGPLAGVRVLELARILAGPWAGQVLADLGADVIKVERSKTGDDTRAWGPPFIEAKDGGQLDAAYFHSTNRGKRSIEADFESEDGRANRQEARRALGRADREFQGRRACQVRPRLQEPGAGMSAADLLLGDRLRPGRTLCDARRLRPDGAGHRRVHEPHRHRRRRADPRRRAGVGYFHRRLFGDRHPRRAAAARDAPARAAMSTPRWSIRPSACWPTRRSNYLASGKVPERIGNAHPNIVPYQVFPVADGYIIIATGNDSQYVRSSAACWARPRSRKEPKYIDNKARLANRAELVGKLSALTVTFKMQDLADKLEAVGVPAGPINDLDQVFDDPHVMHRGMKLDLPSAARQGRHHSGRAHADHARRRADGVGAPGAAARRAHGGNPEGDRRRLEQIPI